MSQVKTFNFDTAADWVFDSSKVEFVGGKAQLKLQDNPGQLFTQNFTSDVGFTYDPLKVEFVGGKVQQKVQSIIENYSQPFTSDVGFVYNSSLVEFASGLARQKSQRSTDATCGATFTNNINLNWGNGVLTGTAFGGATVSGGKLDLTGGTIKYASYAATSNADSYQTGCIKFKLTPDWTGVSVGTQCFFDISKAGAGDVNSLSIRTVSGSSDLNLRLCNYLGNYIVNATFGGFSAISGQQYEFHLNYDFTLGQTSLYVDGVNIGGSHAGTGTRSGVCDQFYIGTTNGALNLARFKIDDFEVFSSPQTVVTGYTIPESDYLESVVTCPTMSYLYNIISLGAPTITEVNAPKYIINGYYWNGAAWAASSNTYATAMTYANWVTNIATFPGAQFGSGAIVKVVFQGSNTLSSIDSIAFNINEEHYVSSNVVVPEMAYTGVGTIISFDDFITTEANSPRYSLQIGRSGNYLYWSGLNWVTSNGTYTQANDKATFLANLSTLPILGQIYGQFKIHFTDSLLQGNIDLLTADLTVQIYPSTDQTIESDDTVLSDEYIDFDETVVVPVNTDIGWIIRRKDGNYYYHNGSAWVVSNKTVAQSNTIAEINAKVSSIIVTGDDYENIHIVAILLSDGSATPQAEDITITYSYYALEPITDIVTSTIYFYVHDLLNVPFEDAEIHVSSKDGFWHTERFILPFERSAIANPEGYVEIEVVETETVNKKLNFKLTYTDPNTDTDKTIKFQSVIVPNQLLTKGTDLLVVK